MKARDPRRIEESRGEWERRWIADLDPRIWYRNWVTMKLRREKNYSAKHTRLSFEIGQIRPQLSFLQHPSLSLFLLALNVLFTSPHPEIQPNPIQFNRVLHPSLTCHSSSFIFVLIGGNWAGGGGGGEPHKRAAELPSGALKVCYLISSSRI